MWTDKHTYLADKAAIGGLTGRRLVGDVYDLGPQRDIGAGEELYLVVAFSTTCTSAGSATIQLEFVSDAQAAIAVDGSATVHHTSGVVTVANAIAGRHLAVIAVPREAAAPYERFLGVIVNVGTAALTAGAINAVLTLSPPVRKAYADGAR